METTTTQYITVLPVSTHTVQVIALPASPLTPPCPLPADVWPEELGDARRLPVWYAPLAYRTRTPRVGDRLSLYTDGGTTYAVAPRQED